MPGRAIPVAQLGVRSGRSSPAASTAPIAASGLFGARLHPRVVRFWEPARSLKARLLALFLHMLGSVGFLPKRGRGLT